MFFFYVEKNIYVFFSALLNVLNQKKKSFNKKYLIAFNLENACEK